MLGLHLEPDADLWRYSQRSVAINSPEAPRLRAWLFSHTYKQVDRKLPRYIAGEERHAGILVPIFEQDGELNLLLTLRSSQLSSHAGESEPKLENTTLIIHRTNQPTNYIRPS